MKKLFLLLTSMFILVNIPKVSAQEDEFEIIEQNNYLNNFFIAYQEMDESYRNDDIGIEFIRRGFRENPQNRNGSKDYYWILRIENITKEIDDSFFELRFYVDGYFEDERIIEDTEITFDKVDIKEDEEGNIGYYVDSSYNRRTKYKPGADEYFMITLPIQKDLSDNEFYFIGIETYSSDGLIKIESIDYK